MEVRETNVTALKLQPLGLQLRTAEEDKPFRPHGVGFSHRGPVSMGVRSLGSEYAGEEIAAQFWGHL